MAPQIAGGSHAFNLGPDVPPGLRADLFNLGATLAVPRCGHKVMAKGYM